MTITISSASGVRTCCSVKNEKQGATGSASAARSKSCTSSTGSTGGASGTRRTFGRWCLIAVAALILCSCRGLDPATRGPHAVDRVAQTGATATPEGLAVAPNRDTVPRADESQVARLPAVPAQQSLSDVPDTAGMPVPAATQVVPVGHATPATPAVPVAGRVGQRVRGAWCPPAVAPQMMSVAPCPPTVPPAAPAREDAAPPAESNTTQRSPAAVGVTR